MKKPALILALLIFSILASAITSWTQIAPPTSPAEQPPRIGDMAPDFTLPSTAKLIDMKLSSMRGKSKVLLAFYVFDFTGG